MTGTSSSGASTAMLSSSQSENVLKRSSEDVGWEYGILANPTNSDKVHKLKQHVANIRGNVAACTKSLDEDKAKLREEVQRQQIQEEEEDIEVIGSRKRPRTLGPMDRFASSINPDSSNEGSKKTRQQTIHDAIWKERAHQMDQYHVMEAVGQFGPGYLPLSQYELREPLLKEEIERVKKSLKKHEKYEAHTGKYIFEYVDKCVKEIGPQNVIQVVTDNASNNMAVANMMKKKRLNMFWTSCATHTLNLMLQGIGNLPSFKGVIDKAKAFTIFIYAHHKTLALMRKHIKKRDIIRPEVTRFATSFLTLQSLMDKKKDLKVMVASDEWEQCKHVKTTKGKTAYATVVNTHFWSGVSLCLKVFEPLFKLLRIVDGDMKPSVGFLYGELQKKKKTKMEIKEIFKNNEANYQPILQIIDEKARDRLDSPLHLAGYLLNSYYFFKDQSIQHGPIVMEGIFTCVEKFFPDNYEVQNQVINVEMHKYRVKEGGFGRYLAELGCVENDENYNPATYNYGNGVPNLQRMAIKILSLTTSSSGYERNWSSFEGIHTKKRNRLDTTRLNNLVYVQFNARILNMKKRKKEKKVDMLLASEASMAQGWIVEGGDET
ncbi:unnamed protein product [Malus baccata var. baccata]